MARRYGHKGSRKSGGKSATVVSPFMPPMGKGGRGHKSRGGKKR